MAGAPFDAGDIYVSAGLDWDDKDEAYLLELKSAKGLRLVRMCYDLIPLKFPQLAHPSARAKAATYFADIARSADAIICISVQTRADLMGYLATLGDRFPRCEVVRLGSQLSLPATRPPPPQLGTSDFILYVSTIERRKNHDVLVKAYARLVDLGFGDLLPKLVFVGMRGWGVDDLVNDIELDPRLQHRIVVLSDLKDDELASLYRGCLFTVFPSFYEGWGLAVSESLAAGKFCLASDAGALPEAGGDLVEYINPLDGIGWSQRLLHFIQHPHEVRAHEVLISARYQPTTWESTARTIFDLAAATDVSAAPSQRPDAAQ